MAVNMKVGDKIVIYNNGERFTALVAALPLGENQNIVVDNGRSPAFYVHPKQCRRLVKKERRRVWIHPSCIGKVGGIYDSPPSYDCLEFVEVKNKC